MADVMTADPITISAGESLLTAWELMCRAGVRHLPVLDEDGTLLGTVHAHTLTAVWHAQSSGPSKAGESVTTLLGRGQGGHVRPADSVRTAARSMLDTGTDHVSVVNAGGELAGLLTVHDLISELAGTRRERTFPTPGMPPPRRIEPAVVRPSTGRRTEVPVSDARVERPRAGPSEGPDGPRSQSLHERDGAARTPASYDPAARPWRR
ncbi:CBS domain-containing protein [Actinomadura sediminis]|uniref:HPP family protein n=1 Tax=Actinomadura sediminis TaxID=1038904 RepID=A0ABW3EG71_9ACTN